MVALLSLAFSLLAASQTLAAPVNAPRKSIADLKFPPVVSGFWWCEYSPPLVQKLLCSRELSTTTPTTVTTPLGAADGVTDTSGVVRFVVRYASANRWQSASLATSWQLPYVVRSVYMRQFYQLLSAADPVPRTRPAFPWRARKATMMRPPIQKTACP